MTIQNAKTKSDTLRKELAAIRARALRRRTRAIALSVFLVAELAALGVSLRFSLTFAVCVGLSVFFALFILFFLQLLRKTPDLRRVARRLETRFPEEGGVLSATLDDESRRLSAQNAMLGLATRRADALVAGLRAVSQDEIDVVLYAGRVDSRSLLRATRSRVTLPLLAAILAGLLLARVGASFVATSTSSREAPLPAAPTLPSEASTRKSEEPLVQSQSAEEEKPSPFDAGDKEDAFACAAVLCEDLERLTGLADALVEELEGGGEGDIELAANLTREIMTGLDGETGIKARSGEACRASAAALRDATREEPFDVGEASRALLTRRRAATLTRYCEESREARAALIEALTNATRARDAQRLSEERQNATDVAKALRERFAEEAIAFRILTDAWRLGQELQDLRAEDEALYERSRELFSNRAGASPIEEEKIGEVASFLERATARRASAASAIKGFEDLAERLEGEDGLEFMTFAAGCAAESGFDALLFGADATLAEGYVGREESALDLAMENAKAQRWGMTTTILDARRRTRPLYDESADAHVSAPTRALAARLTFGDFREAVYDVPVDLPGSVEASVAVADSSRGEEETQGELSSTLTALERDAELGELLADAPDEALETAKEERKTEGTKTGTILSNAATEGDETFGGGVETTRGEALAAGGNAIFLSDDFEARLERFQRSKEWNPPEEYREKAERYRRALWEKTRGNL